MKNISLLILLAAFLLTSCGNNSDKKPVEYIPDNPNLIGSEADTTPRVADNNTPAPSVEPANSTPDVSAERKKLTVEDIAGNWKLVDFKHNKGTFTLTACDKKTIWEFKKNRAEVMEDGTIVYGLEARPGKDCPYYGFTTSWMINNNYLLISGTHIGEGKSGLIHNGVFSIDRLTAKKMELSIEGDTYYFEK